jgi:HK97 family phage prohead protease
VQFQMLQRRSDESITLLKAGNELVVAGYASVELVDKQGDLITKEALKDAFRKFMENPSYRNVQLAHSNIQVGDVVPNYTDSEGRLWKSEVDDVGMFVVIKLRDDIEKAKEVAAEIRKGALRGFSIGGQAFKRVRKSDPKHGDYQEISKLELHEVTICEKGINPEATFRILKEDKEQEKNKKVTKMTDEINDDNVMNQIGDVLGRLETRLDSLEKGKKPAFLEGKDEDKDEKKDDKDKMYEEKKMDKKDMKDKSDEEVEKSEYSDVITSEYLNWMEDALKSAGVDTEAARAHFDGDDLAKQNMGSTPGEIAAGDLQRTGQVKGRATEGGKPSAGALSRAGLSSGGKVEKSDYLTAADVDASDIEAAYEVYKAAAMEQEFRGTLEEHFASRYTNERTEEISKAEAAAFDARDPIASIQKSIEALGERIDAIGTPAETGETLQKSAGNAVAIPSTQDLAQMSWDDVHALAGRAFEGGN